MSLESTPIPNGAVHRLRLAEEVPVGGSGTLPARGEIEQILAEARRTLGRLRADRVMLDQRLVASGRVDPIREIRGRSSLDESIDRTVSVIRRLEHLLESMPRSD